MIGLPFPSESCGSAETGDSLAPVFCSYAAWRGITGSLLTALNFFAISTCSYLRPMPGVLWPVIASEIRSLASTEVVEFQNSPQCRFCGGVEVVIGPDG